MTKLISRPFAVAVLLAAAGTALAGIETLPNGVASGDTTASSTVLWTRSTQTGAVTFEVATTPDFAPGSIVGAYGALVTDPTEPVRVAATGLSGGTRYYYRATDAAGSVAAGQFRTAAAGGRNGLRFGVSGDWRGELAPFPAVRNVADRNLDLWISLGDTVYADYPSPAVPAAQATTLGEFRAKHNEIYSTRFGLNTFRSLRASMSVLATIDDHEVTNDFIGGATIGSDPRFAGTGAPTDLVNTSTLYRNGIQAFQEYHPTQQRVWSGTGDSRFDGRPDLYRNQSYGSDAQVSVLDARSFRDPGLPAANPVDPASIGAYLAASFTPGRTLLGNAQINRLKSDLLSAQQNGTTWKFVNINEPIQNLGVLGASDRFEGYAAERTELLSFIRNNNIENVVFISADIHGTLVNNLTYQTGPGQPQIQTGAWEITTGSVAFDAPFGPTVAGLASQFGILSPAQTAFYNSLPRQGKDGFIENLLNAQLVPLGYDPIGLQGSGIPATLVSGSYASTHTFGWTEFNIDAVTQELLVTTWGIDPYTQAQLNANPALITSLTPEIVSQFRVSAVPTPAAGALLGLGGLLVARRRRPAHA